MCRQHPQQMICPFVSTHFLSMNGSHFKRHFLFPAVTLVQLPEPTLLLTFEAVSGNKPKIIMGCNPDHCLEYKEISCQIAYL